MLLLQGAQFDSLIRELRSCMQCGMAKKIKHKIQKQYRCLSISIQIVAYRSKTIQPLGFPGGLVVRNPSANAGALRDVGLTLESGRSPGVGNINRLQYCCLENSMDRGAQWATIHGVVKSQTQLSTHKHTHNH